MRLFIALLFPQNTVEELVSCRDALHNEALSGSFVPMDNLHLTMEFLGECSSKEYALIKEAMDSLSFESFSIKMDRLGFFSRPDGDIWWVGAEEEPALMEMQRSLHSLLADEGFHLEKRRYRPHITLGRRVATAARPGRIEPIEAEVRSVSLMLSERMAGQMAYTPLYEVAAR